MSEKSKFKTYSKKAKVVLYLPLGKGRKRWQGIGGAEHRLCGIFSKLDKSRFDVSILIRATNTNDEMRSFLGRYIEDWRIVKQVKTHTAVFREIMFGHYDIVCYDDCMMHTKDGIIAAFLAKSKRLLLFVTVPYANWDFKRRWHAIPMLFNVVFSNNLDTLYPSTQSMLARRFPNKVVTVTPCSLLRVDDFSKEAVKECLIVFAGRLIREKNAILFTEACISIVDLLRAKGYRALICGLGPDESLIKQKIELAGCSDVIECCGNQNMADIMPRARVFCSLQQTENYPSQSLLEAIAAGCYCIATDVGNTRTIVKDGFGSLIPISSKSLADEIEACVSFNEEKWQSVVTNAKAFAQTHFMPEKAIAHYSELLESML